MPPLRSCSQNEKPPWLPRPGMDGGMIANADASGTRVRSSPFKSVDDRARMQRRVVALVPGLELRRSRRRCCWPSPASAG